MKYLKICIYIKICENMYNKKRSHIILSVMKRAYFNRNREIHIK
jgi:hypothetical protein